MIHSVAGLISHDASLDGAAEEVEVADDIDNFVSYGFVIKVIFVFAHRAVFTNDEDIVRCEVLAESLGLECLSFFFEYECSSGCDFVDVFAVGVAEGVNLVTEDGVIGVVEIVDDLHAWIFRGEGSDHGVAF